MKDIVIIANFVGGLHGTDNNRFPYLASMLCKDNDVELVASDFCHGEKARRTNIYNFPFKITLLNEPGYKKNICLRRFWSHYVWGKNVVKYLKSRKKPDVVYCAVPSLTAPAKIADYCKKNGIRFIIDVQDLWPEAFQMVFKVPVLSKLVFCPFKYLVDKAYKNADEIVAVSQTYVDRALSVNEKGAKGYSVFLGTNLESFDENVKKKIDWCKLVFPKDDEIWLGYCGTLGKSYDIPAVIDALYLLGSKNKSVPKFIVMGDGPQKAEFEAYSKIKNVDALFTGRMPYECMCALLSLCDIVVNPIVGSSAASIINKHADYASVGKPVINTQNSPEYRRLIDAYEMGINCESGNAIEIAQAVETLSADKGLRIRMGKSARKCAEEKFNRGNTYLAISNII
ncbi:glycosyltransferase family 4 protein [Fibrobacter sp. UWB13]|uniref:glycosyltransferase family 4 protein n=1 Tax=Fibrobacter sp. UWB13 TaxID=1896204 RepID=UPI000A0A0F85|nr:glycosyltransferase family 4 protein [Fibrobacter sp. UWB13]SMG16732.1 Glycosyltransferase involved in cell wall bisynthesis [Fibrobacter sp. UWB13]